MTTKTTTMTTAAASAAAPMASTTSASAFEAARGRGHFGRYGFDGIAQPLPSTQAPVKATPGASWMDRFYPDSFRPKSLFGKVVLLPFGLLMSLGVAIPSRLGAVDSEDVPLAEYESPVGSDPIDCDYDYPRG